MLRWVVAAAALVGAVGCGEESDEPAGASTVSATTVAYPGGHPLAAETGDPGVLARESELEALTNSHRAAMGLNALTTRDDVRAVARGHSEHMIVHSFFGHVNPEGDQPSDRARKAGIAWDAYGENIAGGFATAADAFHAFLNSSGHRANIEDARWTAHGDGYAYATRSTYLHYWTQNFMSPNAGDQR